MLVEEFDLDKAIWRRPAHRMKKERDHIVPLSRQAMQLLRGLHVITGEGVYLFPNKADRMKRLEGFAVENDQLIGVD